LAEFLKEAGLQHDRSGDRRSSNLQSFRHYHLSQQTLNEVDMFSIEINIRTSVQMIE
jgi:hypothetical protein